MKIEITTGNYGSAVLTDEQKEAMKNADILSLNVNVDPVSTPGITVCKPFVDKNGVTWFELPNGAMMSFDAHSPIIEQRNKHYCAIYEIES